MAGRKRNKAKGAKPKGTGAAKVTPTTSQKGLHICQCEHFLDTIGENLQHQFGKHQSIEPSASDTFLSLTIPQLGRLVAANQFALTSERADNWLNYNKDRINALQLDRNLAAAAREQKEHNTKTHKEERQRQIQAQRFAKQAAENAIGFLSFKYGGSVEQRREKFGAQNSRYSRHHPISSSTPLLDDSSSQPVPVLPTATSTLSANEAHSLTENQNSGPLSAQTFVGATDQSSPSGLESGPETPVSTSSHLNPAVFKQIYSTGPLDTPKLSSVTSLTFAPNLIPPDEHDMSAQHNPDTTGGVDNSIKDVIQNLFVLQQHVSVFRPDNQERLNHQVEEIAKSLTDLERVVSKPNNPLHDIRVAPDIIDYVDDGRNPDIYTRDFVELVQRGNSVMNGKQKAFKDFSKVFAKALKDNFDGMDDEVDMIMADAGMEEKDGKFVEKQSKDRNGA